MMLTFSALDWKYPLWAYLVLKSQNYLYKLKFGTEYAEFDGDVNFFCFRPETPFEASLVQKFKGKNWYIDVFKCSEFDDGIYFSAFDWKYSF